MLKETSSIAQINGQPLKAASKYCTHARAHAPAGVVRTVHHGGGHPLPREGTGKSRAKGPGTAQPTERFNGLNAGLYNLNACGSHGGRCHLAGGVRVRQDGSSRKSWH